SEVKSLRGGRFVSHLLSFIGHKETLPTSLPPVGRALRELRDTVEPDPGVPPERDSGIRGGRGRGPGEPHLKCPRVGCGGAANSAGKNGDHIHGGAVPGQMPRNVDKSRCSPDRSVPRGRGDIQAVPGVESRDIRPVDVYLKVLVRI